MIEATARLVAAAMPSPLRETMAALAGSRELAAIVVLLMDHDQLELLLQLGLAERVGQRTTEALPDPRPLRLVEDYFTVATAAARLTQSAAPAFRG